MLIFYGSWCVSNRATSFPTACSPLRARAWTEMIEEGLDSRILIHISILVKQLTSPVTLLKGNFALDIKTQPFKSVF